MLKITELDGYTSAVMQALALLPADAPFTDQCIAIEVAMRELSDQKAYGTEFEIHISKEGAKYVATQVTETMPENFTLVGLWKMVVMACAPKNAPNIENMLVARKVTLGFNKNPVVEYAVGNEFPKEAHH